MTAGSTDPRRVAERLGLDEAVVQRLEARGHLARLGLTEYEIRRRLYHAHRQHIESTKGEVMTLHSRSRTRRAWTSIALLLGVAVVVAALSGTTHRAVAAGRRVPAGHSSGVRLYIEPSTGKAVYARPGMIYVD
jgi:hypothetical protein